MRNRLEIRPEHGFNIGDLFMLAVLIFVSAMCGVLLFIGSTVWVIIGVFGLIGIALSSANYLVAHVRFLYMKGMRKGFEDAAEIFGKQHQEITARMSEVITKAQERGIHGDS